MLAFLPLDDPRALIARVRAGDRAAFAALARALHPAAHRVAMKVLRDPADAEDALQAALLKLWTRAATYDSARGPVAAWFNRMVVNACLDRRRLVRPALSLDAAGDPPSPDPDPEATCAAAIEARHVDRAVARLAPRQRAAILLFYGEDATAAETAAALDTTAKAIEGLLARARADLKRILTDMDPAR